MIVYILKLYNKTLFHCETIFINILIYLYIFFNSYKQYLIYYLKYVYYLTHIWVYTWAPLPSNCCLQHYCTTWPQSLFQTMSTIPTSSSLHHTCIHTNTLSAATHTPAGSGLNTKEDDSRGPLFPTDVLCTTHAYTQTPLVQPHNQYPLLLIHPSLPPWYK